jgi:hypothetical protein
MPAVRRAPADPRALRSRLRRPRVQQSRRRAALHRICPMGHEWIEW